MKDLLKVIAAVTPVTNVTIREGGHLYFRSVNTQVYYHVELYKNRLRLSTSGAILGEYETATQLIAYFIPDKSPEYDIHSYTEADEL